MTSDFYRRSSHPLRDTRCRVNSEQGPHCSAVHPIHTGDASNRHAFKGLSVIEGDVDGGQKAAEP